MSFTEKRLCNPTQLTTSGQTLYTVPASKTAIVKQIVVTNVTGSAATFSLFIGSAATPNALFSGTSVAGNDTIIINLSQVISQNEILTALASANSTLNITISGVENDGPLNPLSTYIADGAITTAKLADSSVTTAKIATGAVVTADLADGAVTTEKIAMGAVATVDIANNAVTQSKLASNLSGITVATSATRSSLVPSPFEGQAVYETDTDRTLIYNGSSWVMPNTITTNPSGLEFIKFDTITSGTSKQITDVFSSLYSNYRIVISNLRGSADFGLQIQMGTTSSAVYYYTGLFCVYGTTTVNVETGQGAIYYITGLVGSSGRDTGGIIEVQQPNTADQTCIQSHGTDIRTGGAGLRMYSGFVNDTNQYTSFTLLTGGANFVTCDVRVYGYRNS